MPASVVTPHGDAPRHAVRWLDGRPFRDARTLEEAGRCFDLTSRAADSLHGESAPKSTRADGITHHDA